jgi:hypothetical protein
MKMPSLGGWKGAKRRRPAAFGRGLAWESIFFGVSSDFIHHSPLQGFEVNTIPQGDTPWAAPIRKNSTPTNARKWWFRLGCQQFSKRKFAYSIRVELIIKSASSIRAITKSLDILASGPGPEWIPSLLARTDGPSIAPWILAFATGETANCSGGRSCARLYLALQGMAVPLRDTTTGMDLTRLECWLQAMAEHATGRWAGNADGVKVIAAAQPEVWKQAQTATAAWKKTQQQQDVRLQFLARGDARQE